jgi:hypothetical protein
MLVTSMRLRLTLAFVLVTLATIALACSPCRRCSDSETCLRNPNAGDRATCARRVCDAAQSDAGVAPCPAGETCVAMPRYADQSTLAGFFRMFNGPRQSFCLPAN